MIDNTTLVFVTFLVSLVIVCGLFITHKRAKGRYKGIDIWAYGILLQGVGSLLSGFKDVLSPIITITLSNILIIAGFCLFLISLYRFVSRKSKFYDLYVLIGLFFVLNIIFTSVYDIKSVRIVIFNICYIYVLIRMFLIIADSAKEAFKGFHTIPMMLTIAPIPLCLLRIGLAFVGDEQPWYGMAMNIFDYVILALVVILILILSISIIFLVNIRTVTEINKQEQKFESIFKSSPYAMFIVDFDTEKIVTVNEKFHEMFGYQRDEVEDKDLRSVGLFDLSSDFNFDDPAFNYFQIEGLQIPLLTKAGKKLVGYVSTSMIQSAQQNYVICSVSDITEIVKMKETLEKHAHSDMLTALPNRRLFQKHVHDLVERNQPFALVTFDLDDFKEVNDDFGHDTGDMVLKKLASRLSSNIRSSDFVARYGGDEFILIVTDFHSKAKLQIIIDRLIQTVKKPIKVKKSTFELTVSIGISMFPDDGKTLKDLFKKADQALYYVKQSHKDDFKLFNENEVS